MKLPAKKIFPVVLVVVLALVVIAAPSGVAMAQSAALSGLSTVSALQAAGVTGSASGTTNTGGNTPTQPVNPYTCTIGTLASCIPYFIFSITSAIFSLIISIAAWIIQVGLQLSLNVYNSPAIQNGFGICLAIANLMFILVIIVIAIATILQSDSYGYKKTLWRLVVAAILVNFGLVITAPIINFANSMTSYFMTSITGGTNGVTLFVNQLAQATSPAAPDQAPTTNCPQANAANAQAPGVLSQSELQQMCAQANQNSQQPSAGTVFTQSMLGLFFGITFKFIVALAFLCIGVLLFVRYLWLAILLILLPFAWLTWIFPNFKKEFGKWWSNFIKWTFFAPAAMFFIWLAMLINQKGYLTQVGNTGVQNGQALNSPATSLAIAMGNSAVLNQFMNDIIILAIMVGGLIAASSMTGKAGSFVVEQAKGVSNAVTGYVGRKTKSGAKTVGRYASDRARSAGKQYNPATRETTTGLQRFGSRLQSVPGFKGVGSTIARGNAPETIKKGREEEIKTFIEHDLKSLTNEGVIARATAKTALVNPTKAAAIAQELARRNLTTDPRVAPRMNDFVAAADRLGNLEKITANRPDLMPPREKAPGIMETKEEATARAVKAAKGDIIQADAEVFNRASPKYGMNSRQVESAALALTPAQLTALGSDTTSGSQDRQNNLTNTLRDLIATLKDPVTGADLKKEIMRQEDEVDPVTKIKTGRVISVPTGKYELDDKVLASLAATRPELKNLEKIVEHMQKSSNWVKVL